MATPTIPDVSKESRLKKEQWIVQEFQLMLR